LRLWQKTGQFIEGLLEDALLFPLRSDMSNRTQERWETVEETPGIWVTRPMLSDEVEVGDDSDDMDDNYSDVDEYGDREDRVRTKLEMRDWVYRECDAVRADAYETDEGEDGQGDACKAEDVDVEDNEDVDMLDPGWCIDPRQTDETWPTIIKATVVSR
jgi:hypothetical protein